MTKKINVKLNKNADEMFRVLSDELVGLQVERDFAIKTAGGEIIINKWVRDGKNEIIESDWDFIKGNEIYNKMSEEEQDKFYDFVQDLRVTK